MKSTALICIALFGASLAAPPQIEPRQTTCPALPSFMQSFDRIVGGQAATSPIPWQVSLRYCNSGGCHFCGGTVLDSKTILTAAHCDVSTSNYIMVGNVNRNQGQNIQVANVINNNWNQQTMDNDIAILKLSTPLTLGGDVQAVCLPSDNFAPADGAPCWVSGWGTLQSGASSLPEDLQWVSVPVSSQSACNSAYNNGITDNMICAGLSTGGKDSCQGDSGGPFVCMEEGKPVITGVVSFGIGCALADYPGVYARVTKYLPWIRANMEGGDGNPPPPPTNGPTEGPTAGPTEGPTEAPGSCVDSWIGDNYCDDQNNVAECQYDGGDCCGDNVDTTYCSACECLEQTTTTTTEEPTNGGGCVDSWIGDNYCDDQNNVAECQYDGGDCCGDNVDTTYCSACECLEQTTTTEEPTGGTNGTSGGCVDSWIGDNYCDDMNNNAGCDFDGGDCCGDNVDTTYCSVCECAQVCEFPNWEGDGWCDDGNNHGGCSFDGGDCCGDDVKTDFCEECECKQ